MPVLTRGALHVRQLLQVLADVSKLTQQDITECEALSEVRVGTVHLRACKRSPFTCASAAQSC